MKHYLREVEARISADDFGQGVTLCIPTSSPDAVVDHVEIMAREEGRFLVMFVRDKGDFGDLKHHVAVVLMLRRGTITELVPGAGQMIRRISDSNGRHVWMVFRHRKDVQMSGAKFVLGDSTTTVKMPVPLAMRQSKPPNAAEKQAQPAPAVFPVPE